MFVCIIQRYIGPRTRTLLFHQGLWIQSLFYIQITHDLDEPWTLILGISRILPTFIHILKTKAITLRLSQIIPTWLLKSPSPIRIQPSYAGLDLMFQKHDMGRRSLLCVKPTVIVGPHPIFWVQTIVHWHLTLKF